MYKRHPEWLPWQSKLLRLQALGARFDEAGGGVRHALSDNGLWQTRKCTRCSGDRRMLRQIQEGRSGARHKRQAAGGGRLGKALDALAHGARFIEVGGGVQARCARCQLAGGGMPGKALDARALGTLFDEAGGDARVLCTRRWAVGGGRSEKAPDIRTFGKHSDKAGGGALA